jgi:hypothetical protein
MSDLRDAARQALEALEDLNGWQSLAPPVASQAGRHAAIILRAALEQPVQEPVAWRTFDGEGGYDYRTYDDNENYRDEWDRRNPNHKGWVEPLYTHPPRREWQSLSEEEINETLDNNLEGGTSLFDICRAIEQALKEKNHDVL